MRRSKSHNRGAYAPSCASIATSGMSCPAATRMMALYLRTRCGIRASHERVQLESARLKKRTTAARVLVLHHSQRADGIARQRVRGHCDVKFAGARGVAV